MCICWCFTEINYKMHGATIKIASSLLLVCRYVAATHNDFFERNRKLWPLEAYGWIVNKVLTQVDKY